MKREVLSKIILGSKVKLTPQGKIYIVHTCSGFGKSITLKDEKGKFIEKSYYLSVYVCSGE